MDTGTKVQHVVVDSGAFIRNASIQTIGENVYTLTEVIGEIRDRATRERLQVLPYTLKFKEPSLEAIKFVTGFSKKTGDYRSLSAVDIKVIALTYQLEKEFVGTDHIRQQPQRKSELVTGRKLLDSPTQIAGFYLDNKKTVSEDKTQPAEKGDSQTLTEVTPNSPNPKYVSRLPESSNEEIVLKPLEQLCLKDGDNTERNDLLEKNDDKQSKTDECESKHGLRDEDQEASLVFPGEGEVLTADVLEDEDNNDESDDDEETDDDGGGWITPGNIKAMKEKLGDVNTEKANVTVGCLTSDFSMQNVLIQMGLNVISVNGMLIKRARSYVLRCFACMKITSNLGKQFCPHCGNNTLQKVSMTVEDDGTIRYFLSSRKPVTTRGLRYSLPAPRGGKHSNNPILCEDQPRPQQRESKKSQHGLNVFDPDYVAKQSPFALNDTTSRAAQLGIRGGQKGAWNKRNPNMGKKKSGRRK